MKNELILRFLFALFAIPITLFIVATGGVVLKLFLLAFLVGAGVEFYLMSRAPKTPVFLPAVLLGILAFAFSLGGIIDGGQVVLVPFLFLAILGTISWEVVKAEPESILKRAGGTALAILYIGGLGSYLLMIVDLPGVPLKDLRFRGAPLILLLLAIWSSDSLAYFMGKYFGKQLLLPKASPKKTLMGLWGSILGGAVGMVLGKAILRFDALPLQWAIGIGLLLGFFGQVGDLFESLLKRSFGVKDSSNLFPGHGGILDRIDALIFCAPIFYYLMRLCT